MAKSSVPARGRTPRRGNRLLTGDFLLKNATQVFSVIVVAFFYTLFVRPQAEYVALESQIRLREDPEGFIAPRSLAIVIKDYEQQAEITLWIWALILMTLKLRRIGVENTMLGGAYLHVESGERILPDDSLAHYKDLQAAVNARRTWQDRILPSVILSALHRFHSTSSIQDASQSIKERTDVSAEEMEADLSLVRYIVWAIPSIGFIGTVRGIGEALAQAQRALAGDITGVTSALGLAFNSTLVALLLSLVLMFLLHLLQGRQDKLFLDIQNFCHERVVGIMKVPVHESGSPAYPA